MAVKVSFENANLRISPHSPTGIRRFFRIRPSLSFLRRHTPRKPANFQPKPVYFRPKPHGFSSFLAHASPPLRHARRKPPFHPPPSHARITRTQPFFVFCLHSFTHPDNPLIHIELGVKISPPFFLHPALHPPHRAPPHNDRGQKWPKAVKIGAQGEAFTRNDLCFKRLSANQREHRQGETFTHNPLTLNILQAKGEEVKAKNRKTPDARASRVRVGRLPCAGRRPSWAGSEKTPLGALPSREKIVTSQGAPPPPLSEQRRIVEILDRFDTLTNSISEGLPREIALRRKQYEYYRDALLRFPQPAPTA